MSSKEERCSHNTVSEFRYRAEKYKDPVFQNSSYYIRFLILKTGKKFYIIKINIFTRFTDGGHHCVWS